MARKRKPKITIRRDRSEQYLVNLKYLGPEPEVKDVVLNDDVRAKALNWYSAMAETADAREYIEAYLVPRPELLEQFRRVPDTYINYTAAALMRLANRGGRLPYKSIAFIEERLDDMLARAVPAKPVAGPSNGGYVPNVQERIRELATEAMGEINGMIDDGVIQPGWSFTNYAAKAGLSAPVVKYIVGKAEPQANELLGALGGDNDTGLDEDETLRLAAVYQGLVDDGNRFLSNAKATRKPRRKRAVLPDKVVAKLNYAKANADYQLKSVAPVKIVGATELWTFNGKTNVLTVYRARTRDGLTVKGSTIKGFDVDTSIAKKMGRKTKDRLNTVLTGGKVALRKIMDDFIGTKIKNIGRVNKDTVLLRVL